MRDVDHHDIMRGYFESFVGGFVCEAILPEGRRPRLLDQVREEIRKRHYSRRTEKSYVGWIRRFILFHGKRHPAEMGLAVDFSCDAVLRASGDRPKATASPA